MMLVGDLKIVLYKDELKLSLYTNNSHSCYDYPAISTNFIQLTIFCF